MISSLQILGYRGFERFEMAGLGRVNLLVGRNNSGKTSVLEAIHLLSSGGNPEVLWDILWRRGERLRPMPPSASGDPTAWQPATELDVSHLFFGHTSEPGSKFRILAGDDPFEPRLECAITPAPRTRENDGTPYADFLKGSGFVLKLEFRPPMDLSSLTRTIALSIGGGLRAEAIDRRIRSRPGQPQFISAESSGEELAAMWNRIALTPSEDLVLKALQFLDAGIERVAVQAGNGAYSPAQARSAFIVKRKGWDQPVPIGSMGDGMWRMLALAIAITQCKGGVLLVDEIDTGLHYTAMSQMWNLIQNAARDFNVQVFATTHSYDCIHSLAKICTGDSSASVTVQRVEQSKNRAVPYDESEIIAAAERDIEVL